MRSAISTISTVRALEILDSRGDPTVRVTVTLSDGSSGTASVPGGASRGKHEAYELRDTEEPARYRGKGVQKAVANVEGPIASALRRRNPEKQERIDEVLRSLDGTPDKSALGANAIVGVSLAVARAAASACNLPLYAYLRSLTGSDRKEPYLLPLPHLNVVNGARHADSGLDIQEFLVLPIAAPSFREALRAGSEVFKALGEHLQSLGHSTTVGDEGGYAPKLERNDEVFELLRRAVESSGRALGSDIVFGIDAAASGFHDSAAGGSYALRAPTVTLTTDRLIALYAEWMSTWPLRTIEDPLAEDDWDGWAKATEKLHAAGAQIVGDDLFVTNLDRLKQGVERRCATAILIKVNQIGTLSETLAAVAFARTHHYGVVISHRSGETADTFIADLAVAVGSGQMKAGSVSRGERVEKYNRLLAIEAELGEQARYAGAAALAA